MELSNEIDKVEYITTKDFNTNYLLQNNFTFPVYYPDQNFPKVLQVRAIPSSFLIDKKGQIVWHKTGVENFNKASFRKKIDALVK